MALPFIPILLAHWLFRPRLKTGTDFAIIAKSLAGADNRFRENGHFRKRTWLDGDDWELQLSGNQPVKIAVPACWNSIPGLENYKGFARYRKLQNLPPAKKNGQRTFLCFRGVSYQTRVFLDNKLLGEHQGAYTPFEIEVPPGQGGTLEVLVDNRLSDSTLPGRFEGWKHIGGIYREVYLEERNAVFIKDLRIIAEPASGAGEISIDFFLDNALSQTGRYLLQAELWGTPQKLILKKELQLDGEKELKLSLAGKVLGVSPWSPESPHLYPLTVRLYSRDGKEQQLVDELSFQVGFRKIKIKGNQLYLNDRLLKIQGLSRHNFYPGYYQSIPPDLLAADFAKIKELGANLVRLGHYPNHPYVLQLCDELGLLVWEEIPAWGRFSPDYAEPRVLGTASEQLKEMIIRDRNHPSLLLVGLANEIPADRTSGEIFVSRLAQFARPFLGNQLLAAASSSYEKDRTAQYLDVIGFNCYWGWYGGKVDDSALRFSRLAQTFKNMPVLVSEYGADANLGRHGARGDIYTEENQARFLEQTFKNIENTSGLSGGIIWLFADFPDPLRVMNPRPFFNQKGLVDETRAEKIAYKVAQALYRGRPFVFQAKSQLASRIRDSALASVILLVIFFGLSQPIPERWLLVMPGLGRWTKLIRRAVLTICFQTLILEFLFRSFWEHQPLVVPSTFSFPALKLIQLVFNSSLRPCFFFVMLFLLWLALGQFLDIFSNSGKFRRHPFELALGTGDPFALALPYPLIAFFPVLAAIALNLPSLLFSGGDFKNQFTTTPWIFLQISFLVLMVLNFFKMILVFRSGMGISLARAFTLMAAYIILFDFFALVWFFLLMAI